MPAGAWTAETAGDDAEPAADVQACVVLSTFPSARESSRTRARRQTAARGRGSRGAEPEAAGDGPEAPDAGEASELGAGGPLEPGAGDLLLPALPGEGPAGAGLRAAGFRACWADLNARVEATLQASDRAALEQLEAFVWQSSAGTSSVAGEPPGGARPAPARGLAPALASAASGGAAASAGAQLDFQLAAQVPTALVLAGSVNATDLRGTFGALAAHLRANGAHVASLRSGTCLSGAAAGDELGALLGAALRQWAGLERPGPAHRALLRLWRRGAGPGPVVLLLEDAEAFSGQLLRDLCKLLSELRAAEEDNGIGDAGDGSDAGAGAGEAGAGASSGGRAPGRAPGRGGLRVALLLGLCTSTAVLRARLPPDALQFMAPAVVKLAPALSTLDAIIDGVLMGGARGATAAPALAAAAEGGEAEGRAEAAAAAAAGGGVLGALAFSHGVAQLLTEQFVDDEFTLDGFRRGLKLAVLDHFMTAPLSCLAAPLLRLAGASAGAAASSSAPLKAAVAALPKALLLHVRATLPLAGDATDRRSDADLREGLAAALAEAGPRRAGWAAALRCLRAAAEVAGIGRTWPIYQLWRDCLARGLLDSTSEEGAQFVGTMSRVTELGTDRVAVLLRRCMSHVDSAGACLSPSPADDGGAGAGGREAPLLPELAALRARMAALLSSIEAGSEPADGTCGRGPSHGDAAKTAAALASMGRAGPGAKRRRDALAAAVTEGIRTDGGRATGAGALAAGILRDLARDVLVPWQPDRLPGAAAFCVARSSALAGSARPAPRPAIIRALGGPRGVLRCACCPEDPCSSGPTAAMEDISIAFTTLQEFPETVHVQPWFEDFVAAYHPPPERHAGGGGAAAGPSKGKKRARSAAPAGDEGGEGEEGDADGSGDDSGAEEAGGAAPPARPAPTALPEGERHSLQARFSWALAELQWLGILRPSKRRSHAGEVMTRVIFDGPVPLLARGPQTKF